jgi:hypothetical protein
VADVLSDIVTIATDTTFQGKVAAGMAWKANFISTQTLAMEAPTQTDKLRLQLAREIMLAAGDSQYKLAFSWAVAALPDIADASASDSAILSAIDSLWNVIAGVTV